MKKRTKITSVLLAGALVIGLPYSAISVKKASAKKPVQVQYVALGDSLAAGQTPQGYLDYGYPDYIMQNFKGTKYKVVDYDNFSVPGYTSIKLKDDLLKSYKIRKDIKDATHITIDIGANDFLSILKTNPDPVVALTELEKYAANLDTILSTIDDLNPKAKVYVMGYYNPFPYLTQEQQEVIQPLLQAVNTQIEVLADENKDIYVPTEEVVANQYETYLPNKEDIHLSKSGYQAIAKEFWKKMK